MTSAEVPAPFWTFGVDALCARLGCRTAGLDSAEAGRACDSTVPMPMSCPGAPARPVRSCAACSSRCRSSCWRPGSCRRRPATSASVAGSSSSSSPVDRSRHLQEGPRAAGSRGASSFGRAQGGSQARRRIRAGRDRQGRAGRHRAGARRRHHSSRRALVLERRPPSPPTKRR